MPGLNAGGKVGELGGGGCGAGGDTMLCMIAMAMYWCMMLYGGEATWMLVIEVVGVVATWGTNIPSHTKPNLILRATIIGKVRYKRSMWAPKNRSVRGRYTGGTWTGLAKAGGEGAPGWTQLRQLRRIDAVGTESTPGVTGDPHHGGT